MENDKTKLRRNDEDVTATVRTTDAGDVAAEVVRIYAQLFGGQGTDKLQRAFRDIENLYGGEHPQYCPCDTEYHDLQHILEVTLAMARLMDGYRRARRESEPPLSPEHFIIGIIAALFHDFGYLRRRSDRGHRYGAEYTVTHVSRSAAFLRGYTAELGFGTLSGDASRLVHYTGYEIPAEKIQLSSRLMRRLGQMLGSADIIAQVSDRCYLEKCRDRLYPEFVVAQEAAQRRGKRFPLPAFKSGDDLIQKTPGFYKTAAKRLEVELGGAYLYAESHFAGLNYYLEPIRRNVEYAQTIARSHGGARLQRRPPNTLVAGVEPYPRT